ncbi:Uncharacterised protein [Mycobacteroides abscessus subsp. abscessus]|nr:Uncharacterised protein [Mycobacteroides abscessus subsp. abscessus]
MDPVRGSPGLEEALIGRRRRHLGAAQAQRTLAVERRVVGGVGCGLVGIGTVGAGLVGAALVGAGLHGLALLGAGRRCGIGVVRHRAHPFSR